MMYNDHATEIALTSLERAQTRKLRTWKLERKAVLERSLLEHKQGKLRYSDTEKYKSFFTGGVICAC